MQKLMPSSNKSILEHSMYVCHSKYVCSIYISVNAYAAKGSIPQENQAHTAQNQPELPKEQLTVDLRT